MSVLGKGYQPKTEADNPYLDLDFSGYREKTSSNNFFRTKAKSMHLGSPSTQLKITLKPNHLAKSSRQKKKKTCLLYRSTMKTSAAHIQFSPRLYFRPGDNWSVLLLSKYFQMWNMSTKRLKEGLLVTVPHPKLLTRLTDDGSNLRIVKLTHAREEVMGCLMIESSWK